MHSLALSQPCTPTHHILSCQHVLVSRTPVPCSETCRIPHGLRGAFAYHCPPCRRKSDEQLLSCLAALGTMLYVYDPRLPTPSDLLRAESLTLHDRSIPTSILGQLMEPFAAHKFWFQYRLRNQVNVSYVLLTRDSVRGRLVKCSTGFAITADAEVTRIMCDSKAKRQAKSAIRRVVRGVQSSMEASAWWTSEHGNASEREVPEVGQQLERDLELSRGERKELWDEVLRLTNTSPARFWSDDA